MTLKLARLIKGLTQIELAYRTKIRDSRISLIERGYSLPTEKEHRKLARALSMEPEELEFSLRQIPE